MQQLRTPVRPLALAFPLALAAACGGGASGHDSILPSAAIGASDFDLRTDVAGANSGLIDGLLVDLDADGRMDLVQTDHLDNTVAVSFGLEDGSFLPTYYLLTPSGAWSVAAGDFGGDGRLDLAVACVDLGLGGGHQLAIYEQNAGGDFLLTAVAALPSVPFDVAAAAVEGNGRDQVLVGMLTAGEVRVFDLDPLGGLGVLDVLASTDLGAAQVQAVTALDLDADGLLDVASGEINAGASPGRVARWTRLAAGGYESAEIFLDPVLAPLFAPASDVDQNGLVDLIVAQMDASWIEVCQFQPSGAATTVPVDLGGGTTSAVVRDLDGDGLVDAAGTLWKEQTVGVRLGSGPAIFGGFGSLARLNVGIAPRALAAHDVTGDGQLDLVCVNSGDVSILTSLGSEFVGAKGTPAGAGLKALAVADLDLDGRADVVATDPAASYLCVFRGQSDGTLALADELSLAAQAEEPLPGGMALADFDGDELIDVALGLEDTGQVRIAHNLGALDFELHPLALDVGPLPLGLDAADLDGDGDADLAVANTTERALRVALGDGALGFTAGESVDLAPYRPEAVLAVDVDNDGDVDLVLSSGEADLSGNALLVLENDGAAHFVLRTVLPVGAPAADLACADLDADGLCDVVASQGGASAFDVVVALNLGGFAFAAASIPVGMDPGSVAVADIDGDGDLDLVCPLGSGELRIALGDGQGAFPALLPGENSPAELPVPFGTSAAALADIDGDTRLDLVMVSPFSAAVWVGKNRKVQGP
jgi:hypothetical protein